MERRKGDVADSVPERTNARNGFSNELMYGQNTEKKKTSSVRTTERRTKKIWGDKRVGTRENKEPKAYGRRTRKRAGFTQQFLNKYFSINRERNKERKRRKEGAEDRNARYGRRRGLDPLSLSTRNFED